MMTEKIIVSDFDGVLGNSLELALRVTRNIVDLFDKKEEVNTFYDYYRLLGKKTTLAGITQTESATLRELYRIMMRHNSASITLFDEVIEIYNKLRQQPIIVSSSYADLVKIVLNDRQAIFQNIYGYESGHKRDILSSLFSKTNFVYITDTFRDVQICKGIGIPVIATCWGYDSKEKIIKETPDFLANNFIELSQILYELKFLNNG